MKIFIFKPHHLLITATVLAFILICFSCSKNISVFNSSERKIPIYSVERNDNKIALTFDCAWNDSDIDNILTILDKNNIKASFFVTGKWAEEYPESVKKIYENGHDIGNHSYNHADYTTMSKNDVIKDLDKCDSAIESIIGQKCTLMRAPSGGYNNTVMSAAEDSGRIYIQWSIDGLDYTTNATEESIKNRVFNTAAGDIILMHNGTKLTAKVLPEIITELSKKYDFVKVSELIYPDNRIVDHTGRQKIPMHKASVF